MNVVGITISKKQQKLAAEHCKGLDVEIRLQDYRELNEPLDRVVSLGMFEHVGYKNYRTYMQVVNRCLKKGGRFVLHSIGSDKSVHTTDPWIEKYIFPNSMITSVRQIGLSMEELFILERWENHGFYYEKTLIVWYEHFLDHWDQLKDRYTDRFFGCGNIIYSVRLTAFVPEKITNGKLF